MSRGHLRWVKLISLEHNSVLFYDLKKIHGITIFITMLFCAGPDITDSPISHDYLITEKRHVGQGKQAINLPDLTT